MLRGQEVGYINTRSLFDEGALGDLVGETHALYLLSCSNSGWSVKREVTI